MTITCKLCPTPAWFDFGHGSTLCEHCAAKMLERCRIDSVSDGVPVTSLLAEIESVAMPVLAPSESNPIPSLNPPGSADSGAALDDKAAPLFSLDETIPKILQRDSNNEPMARGG